MDPITIAIFVIVLLFSVIFHEVAHGLIAYRLGDPTAKFAGRLTLNPIPHIDPIGSILLPAALAYLGLPILGAAKPVPVNYNNLSNIRRDMFLVSFAGPLTNFLLALLAAVVLRLAPGLSSQGADLLYLTIQTNLILAVFNILPIPPLDGSKMLASIFGYVSHDIMYRILAWERFGFVLILAFLMIPQILSNVLWPPVMFLMKLLVGGG